MIDGHPYELIRRLAGPHQPLDWAAIRRLLDPEASHATWAPRPVAGTSIEHLANWVARLPEGRRNTGTFWAACRAAEHGITDLRPLIDAATQAGLPRAEAARTVTSALHRIAASGSHTPSARPSPAPQPRTPKAM